MKMIKLYASHAPGKLRVCLKLIFVFVPALAMCFWGLACTQGADRGVLAVSESNLYPNGSVFTVDIFGDKKRQPRIPAASRDPNHASYDVAVLEFKDDGTYADRSQIKVAVEWIDSIRQYNSNGAIVVLFIHGWHHSSIWNSPTDGDSHFQSFRLLLASLALREAERSWPNGAGGRRVMGIYVGWNGDPRYSILKMIPGLTNLTFWGRYDTAERIGAGEDLRNAIQAITSRTKASIPYGGPGQLILIGHSMGGLMLESALLALIKVANGDMLQSLPEEPANPISIRIGADRVIFPDAVITLNSAADSQIARRIKSTLAKRNVSKQASGVGVKYNPPLAIAVTSTADEATGVWWPRAKPGRSTVGHDATLFTHTLTSDTTTASYKPRLDMLDFGQNYHLLRYPEPSFSATPTMVVDLPVRERKGINDWPEHRRYRLKPKGENYQPELFWNFQVSPELISDHNDIFNSRSGSMILALIQMSGAVASLAQDWDDGFEQ